MVARALSTRIVAGGLALTTLALAHCGSGAEGESSSDTPGVDAGVLPDGSSDPGYDRDGSPGRPSDPGARDASDASDADAGDDAGDGGGDAGARMGRVSEGPLGVDGNAATGDLPGISNDGRFVSFYSSASNLVAGDTNGTSDAFVYDHATGSVMRVSVGLDGAEANGSAGSTYISGDGRFVAFTSSASNLVAGDTNGNSDVFLFDRTTNTTLLVSRTASALGNASSSASAISNDGKAVLFSSYATNLAGAADTNDNADVFLFDRQTTNVQRISVSSNGVEANGSSGSAAISSNGLFAAFDSTGSNLVSSDTNGARDVFVRDIANETTTRVSVSSGGVQGNGTSAVPFLSADGRYVAFLSNANNLVPNDTNGFADIFVHDRTTSTTTRINLGIGGAEANGHSENPKLSADGRYVLYRSDASNLVPGDTNGAPDVFLYDTVTSTTRRINVSSAGVQADEGVSYAAFASGGRAFAFSSSATNLVAKDQNGVSDVFLGLLP